MKKKILTTAALLCCFMVCFAMLADLNGKWSGVIKIPDGSELPVTYKFKADGNKLTGTADSPQGTSTVDDGKINGSDFSFSVNVQGVDYPHTGKFYTDSCGMDVDISGQKVHFVVKRADN